MASRSRRRRKRLAGLCSSAAVAVIGLLAVVVVTVLAAGGLPAQEPALETRTVSVRKATPHPRPMTRVTQQSTTSSLPRPTTTTTVVPTVKVTRPEPVTRETTTTTRPAAPPRPTLGACLALADANNYKVIAANEVWFQQQLRFLADHRSAPRLKELQIEEANALLEIDAEYTVDKSNCYLG